MNCCNYLRLALSVCVSGEMFRLNLNSLRNFKVPTNEQIEILTIKTSFQ
jgi:hypothetical protein